VGLPSIKLEIEIMRLIKAVPIAILSFACSFAFAKDKDCSDIDNDRARQECLQHKSDDVNCNNLNSDNARKQCREAKYGSSGHVDCSKFDSDKLRRECREEKWD
jgi:hypothetical protein